MNSRRYCLISGALFFLVALAHLIRVLLGLPVRVGDVDVPMSVSWIGVAVPAALTIWAFRIAGRSSS